MREDARTEINKDLLSLNCFRVEAFTPPENLLSHNYFRGEVKDEGDANQHH
jgi:hypothetical protein